MADFLRQTNAFEVRDGGPFALRAWDFELGREDYVRVGGGRVLLFENFQRVKDFLGHISGRGRIGNKAWGAVAAMNIQSHKPEHRDPQLGDIWCREWYARIEDSPRARARMASS